MSDVAGVPPKNTSHACCFALVRALKKNETLQGFKTIGEFVIKTTAVFDLK
jgi:hypothetical protein